MSGWLSIHLSSLWTIIFYASSCSSCRIYHQEDGVSKILYGFLTYVFETSRCIFLWKLGLACDLPSYCYNMNLSTVEWSARMPMPIRDFVAACVQYRLMWKFVKCWDLIFIQRFKCLKWIIPRGHVVILWRATIFMWVKGLEDIKVQLN